jgi:hypothetical protein
LKKSVVLAVMARNKARLNPIDTLMIVAALQLKAASPLVRLVQVNHQTVNGTFQACDNY